MKSILKATAGIILASAIVSSPAMAAKNKGPAATPTPTPPAACALSDIANAEACSGFYAGNLLAGNKGDIAAQVAGLSAIGFTFDGNWSVVEGTKINPLGDGFSYDFASLLNGTTYIGIHKGNANGAGGTVAGTQGTAFYRINATNLDVLKVAFAGGSSAVLYSTQSAPAVPEPSTWALLMLGFAAVGFTMRRQKGEREVRVRYA